MFMKEALPQSFVFLVRLFADYLRALPGPTQAIALIRGRAFEVDIRLDDDVPLEPLTSLALETQAQNTTPKQFAFLSRRALLHGSRCFESSRRGARRDRPTP